MSSQLVIIESMCEGEFVHKLATSRFWIGLSDTQTEGIFLWTSGQVPVYTNWSPGEPNDDKFHVSTGEDCVEIRTTANNVDGLWNDNPCERLKSYVCKKGEFWLLQNCV